MIFKKAKALLLFSGGLDSILAAKILEKMGFEVTALTFVSYFFDAAQAKKSAKKNGIKLKTIDFSEKHFKVVKKPCFGRGAGMNPCIDCHLLMLKEAKKIAIKEKYNIIATGEVLGQRPMSQNREALKLIERKAGLSGKILRPLSAKILPETEYEKSELVSREKLLGISGRGRKEQISFAKKYGIKFFPTPAGGCILTNKEYSKKLKELFEKRGQIRTASWRSDLALLRIGRHFWNEGTKIILGRNHAENLELKIIAQKSDTLFEPQEVPGPTALLRGKKSKENIDQIRKLILKYTKNSNSQTEIKILKK